MSAFRLPLWTDNKWALFRRDLETGASRRAVATAHGMSESGFHKYLSEGRSVQSEIESEGERVLSERERLVLKFAQTVDEATAQAEISLIRPLVDAATGQGSSVEVSYKFGAAQFFEKSSEMNLTRPPISDTEAMLQWLEAISVANPGMQVDIKIRSRPIFDMRAAVFLLKSRHGYRDAGVEPDNDDAGHVPDVYL